MPHIEFTRPIALLLLALIWPAVLWHKNSIAEMPHIRRRIVFITRLALIISLVFALSGFQLKLPADQVSVIYVVDRSLSISGANQEWALEYIRRSQEEKATEDQAGVVVFGRDAFLEESLTGDLRLDRFSSIIDSASTDIGQGIQLASAVFPENTIKRIVLVTDGNENLGNAVEEASMAAARGVEINILPYPRSDFPEVLISRVEAPGDVAMGAPFALKVMVESNQPAEGILNIFRNEELIAREEVVLEEGQNLFTITQRMEEPDNYLFRATIESPQDHFAHNNHGETMTIIKGKPRILYLSSNEQQAGNLDRALKIQNFIVDTGTAEDLPGSLSQLSRYKGLIFDNINGLQLSPTQLQMIENFVKDVGGGFVMVGGPESFGAGGYHLSPVERILPVDMDVRKRKSLPSVALVLCIDKSGSMSERTGNVEKMALAREAAIATVNLLEPRDLIGVIGFDYASKWVSKLQPATNKRQIISDIASLRAGGGTHIYPALDAAYQALKESDAMVRHVIVLTDGRSAPGDFLNLARQMSTDKITISTIGVGRDSDLPFLENLASWGQGRFYYADDATALPRIFVREIILTGRSPIVEEVFDPVETGTAPFLSGIDTANLPPLTGYVVTTPRPMANTVLKTHQDDPLLAYWRIGLGKSVAFTSDNGLRWAMEWARWEDYSRFWSQLVRWIVPDLSRDDFMVRSVIESGRGQVVVEAIAPDGEPVNFLDLSVRVVSPSGKSGTLPLSQTGSGRYEADFEAGEVGTYMLNTFNNTDGSAPQGNLQTVTLSYSPEYRDFSTNRYLLEKIASATGGSVIDTQWDVFRKTGQVAYHSRPTWRELLLLILLLFPLDIALRRVYLPRELKDKFAVLLKGASKNKEAIPQHGTMGALLARKEAVRERFKADVSNTESMEILRSAIEKDGSSKMAVPGRESLRGESQTPITPATFKEEEIESVHHQPDPADDDNLSSEKSTPGQDSTLSRLKKIKRKFRQK